MKRLRKIYELDYAPETLLAFHRNAFWIWATGGIAWTVTHPNSILWIAFMSVYACCVGHFSGLDAVRAELEAKG